VKVVVRLPKFGKVVTVPLIVVTGPLERGAAVGVTLNVVVRFPGSVDVNASAERTCDDTVEPDVTEAVDRPVIEMVEFPAYVSLAVVVKLP
jgi:hypothetical protein